MWMIAIAVSVIAVIMLVAMLVYAAQLRRLSQAREEAAQPVAPGDREARFTRRQRERVSDRSA